MVLLAGIAAVSIGLSMSGTWLVKRFLDGPLFLTSWLGLQRTENAGIAWGIRLPPIAQEILIAGAFLFLCFFVLRRRKHSHPVEDSALGLTLGGAMSNILDRIPDGLVTDYLFLWPFPLFNIADLFLTLGILLLFITEGRLAWQRRGC